MTQSIPHTPHEPRQGSHTATGRTLRTRRTVVQHPAIAALAAAIALAGLGAVHGADAQEAGIYAKFGDEFAGLEEMVRSMGVDVPALVGSGAAPFYDRLNGLAAEHEGADEARRAVIEARASVVTAEYGLAALALSAERTDAVERASEFLSRLASLYTRHAAALAADPEASIDAEYGALLAEYGLRFSAQGDERAAKAAGIEAVTLARADGSTVTLTGERAAEFIRRTADLDVRYAAAYDAAASANRTAALAALADEYNRLYAEFGIGPAIAEDPPAVTAEPATQLTAGAAMTGSDGNDVTDLAEPGEADERYASAKDLLATGGGLLPVEIGTASLVGALDDPNAGYGADGPIESNMTTSGYSAQAYKKPAEKHDKEDYVPEDEPVEQGAKDDVGHDAPADETEPKYDIGYDEAYGTAELGEVDSGDIYGDGGSDDVIANDAP